MGRNLVILFDGTWNTVESETNVCRLREALADRDATGTKQECFYAAGVGTKWYQRIRGGVFGLGLSGNIQAGYRWLAEKYETGDRIFVFGFSRGAYTARSLVGLLRKSGLVNTPDAGLVERAYEMYRDKDVAPDSPAATGFRGAHSREVGVRFVGVWDTVGALGIPASGVPFSRDYYRWHDTELSKIVEHAYHALAVDEHRADYAPSVWSRSKPENREVEQRWFVGAHSNVGGGYPDSRLSNPPLFWLQEKARQRGLALKSVTVGPEDHLDPIRDSFGEFAYGIYKVVKRGKRHFRPIGQGVNEVVDESVWKRIEADKTYRPPSVLALKKAA